MQPLGATRTGMSTASGLGLTDTVVFGILTVAGYVVGFYFSFTRSRRIEKSAVDGSGVEQEAFLGGRTLPSYALAVSVVASTANAVSIVGFVGHYYAHGFHYMWPGAAIPLAAAVAATVMVPLLYRLRVASVFQYLRMRFDNKVGTTACIVFFILSQILGAVGVYSSAIAVSTMFPIPMVYSSIAIGLAGTIYTALGGLRSVVWADCVQALVMFASPFIIIGKVIYDSYYVSPPLRPIVDINVTDYVFRQESSNDDISRGLDNGIAAFDFTAGDESSSDHPGTTAVINRTNLDFTTDENMWSGLAGAIPFSFVRTVFDQMAVQRFMAAKTLREAQRISICGPLFVLCFFLLGATTGIVMIYWYRDCNPVLSGIIKSFDQIVPHYMKERLSEVTALRGVFLAGLVGASTSTVSSIVNSHAAIFYIDIVKTYVRLNERRAVLVMRNLALTSGTIMTLLAIAAPNMGTAARLFFSFYSTVSGPFAGLLFLALSSPWVNAKGAAWSTLLVCLLQLWHAIGRSISPIAPDRVFSGTLDRCPNKTSGTASVLRLLPVSGFVFPLYQVSFHWMSFVGALLTLFLGTVFSYTTDRTKTIKQNLHLTSPIFLNFWRRFKFLRRKIQFEDCMAEKSSRTLGQQYENECIIPCHELLPMVEMHRHPEGPDV